MVGEYPRPQRAALAHCERITGTSKWIQSKADARAPEVRTIESLAIRKHPSTSERCPIPHGRVGSKAEMALGISSGSTTPETGNPIRDRGRLRDEEWCSRVGPHVVLPSFGGGFRRSGPGYFQSCMMLKYYETNRAWHGCGVEQRQKISQLDV